MLIAVFVSSRASSVHSQVAEIGHTDAPSVTAMSDFLFELQDMDAQLANALLINGDTTLTVSRDSSVAIYEKDRSHADQDLQQATEAMSGDPAEQRQLALVLDLFGTYQENATRALQLDEQSGVVKAGGAPPAVVTAFQAAEASMSGPTGAAGLVAAAQSLHTGGVSAVGTATRATQSSISSGSGELIAAGILLVGALAALQFWLYLKFQRALNPALAAATVVALVFLGAGASMFGDAGSALTNAQHNAFLSVQALTDAKAIGYDANADESRYLLDRANSAHYEQTFFSEATQIAGTPQASGLADYASGLQAQLKQLTPDTLADTSLSGKFGDEFKNITFPGESQAALTAFQAYVTYIDDDHTLRSYDTSTASGLASAVALDTDATRPGTSDADFNAYSGALDKVTAINQDQFDGSIGSALSGVGPWSWLSYGFALLIAGLVVLGLRPRIREYR